MIGFGPKNHPIHDNPVGCAEDDRVAFVGESESLVCVEEQSARVAQRAGVAAANFSERSFVFLRGVVGESGCAFFFL